MIIKKTAAAFGLLLFALAGWTEIPRTADGKPDLSGFFDIATLTPLQRPEELGEKGFISQSEAEEIASSVADTRSKSSLPSDPERDAPESGGDGTAGAGGGVGGYNDFWLDYGSGRFKLKGRYPTSIITFPQDGRYPQMTALGNQRMAVALSDFRVNTGKAWWLDQEGPGPFDNMEQRPLRERCLLGFGPAAGPPTIPTAYNNLKRIIQTPESVMILAEMVHDARVIPIGGAHRPDDIRSWMGDSVGRWEGDTLVVEVRNLNGRTSYLGSSEDMKLTQRFTRTGPNTLQYEFTVEDPAVWTQPWTGMFNFIKDDNQIELVEYACHEGNYGMTNTLSAARTIDAREAEETEYQE